MLVFRLSGHILPTCKISSAAVATTSAEDSEPTNYTIWQADFIEDAVCMHLATKREFSSAIHSILKDPDIRGILEEDGQLGKSGILNL